MGGSMLQRGALAAIAGFVMVGLSPLAARAFPERPITLIVPFAPGGANDITARILAEPLREALGQPVVIENRGGAGGNIGITAAQRAKPDGYTLLLASTGFVVNPSLYEHVTYDPIKDFAPIAYVAQFPVAIVVTKASKLLTMKDLLERARAKPGSLNYSSAGAGTATHLAAELIKLRAGIQMVHVPHSGAAPALQSLLTESVEVGSLSVSSVQGQIQAGTLVPLAVTGAERWPDLPDVPTLQESGVANTLASNDRQQEVAAAALAAVKAQQTAMMAMRSSGVSTQSASTSMAPMGTSGMPAGGTMMPSGGSSTVPQGPSTAALTAAQEAVKAALTGQQAAEDRFSIKLAELELAATVKAKAPAVAQAEALRAAMKTAAGRFADEQNRYEIAVNEARVAYVGQVATLRADRDAAAEGIAAAAKEAKSNLDAALRVAVAKSSAVATGKVAAIDEAASVAIAQAERTSALDVADIDAAHATALTAAQATHDAAVARAHEIEAARVADATIAAAGAIATAQLTFAKVVSQAEADCADQKAAADATEQKAEAKAEADAATAIAKAEVQKLIADATAELVCAAQIENATTHAGERKRCQPPNLGELGDLLAADAIAAQADASQAEPAPLVRMAWCTCRPSRGDGRVRRRPSERAGLLRQKVPATKSGGVRRSAGSRNRHGLVTGLAAVTF